MSSHRGYVLVSKARLPPAPILAPRGSFTPVRLTQPSDAQVRSEKLALEAAFLAEEKRRQEENPVPPPLSKDFKKNDSPLFSSPPSFRREPVVPRQTSSWTARAPSTYGRLFLQPIPRVALEGFRNTGNTCYMNSILAALLHLPAFVRVLQNPTIWGMLRAPPSAAQKPSSMCTGVVDLTEDGDVEPSASSAPVPPSVSLAAVFESLRRLAEMRMDSHEVIDPADVKKAMIAACKRFDQGRQEDAHEFLVFCLAEVEAELDRILHPKKPGASGATATPPRPPSVPMPPTFPAPPAKAPLRKRRLSMDTPMDTVLVSDSDDSEGDDDTPASASAGWDSQSMGSAQRSDAPAPSGTTAADASDSKFSVSMSENLLYRCFGFEVNSVVTCTRCGTARSKSVYLNHLSVDPEIPPEFSKECLSFSFTAGGSGIPTISDLLEVEMSETTLEYKCEEPGCSGNVVTERKKLVTLPRVLIIQIKRFAAVMEDGRFIQRKNVKPVWFSRELSLDRWCDVSSVRHPVSVDEPLGKHSAPSACAPRVKDDDETGLKKARKYSFESSEDDEPAACASSPTAGYHLQAIVRHEGSTSFSGHYKTAVKGVVSSDLSAPFRTDQIWRMHDDARVSEIPSSALVNEDAQRGAYLLFYVLKEG